MQSGGQVESGRRRRTWTRSADERAGRWQVRSGMLNLPNSGLGFGVLTIWAGSGDCLRWLRDDRPTRPRPSAQRSSLPFTTAGVTRCGVAPHMARARTRQRCRRLCASDERAPTSPASGPGEHRRGGPRWRTDPGERAAVVIPCTVFVVPRLAQPNCPPDATVAPPDWDEACPKRKLASWTGGGLPP